MFRSALVAVISLSIAACIGSDEASQQPQMTDSQKLAAKGREKLRAGDKASAHGFFKASIQADKSSTGGRYGLAVLQLLEGNTEAAQQELLALRTAGADVETEAPWLTALLDGRKHFPAPLKGAATAVAEDAPTASSKTKTVEPPEKSDDQGEGEEPPEAVLFRQGRYVEVVKSLASVEQPTVFQSKLLADAYYNLQDWTKAVAAYRKVLRSEPGNEPVTQYLADALFRLKRYDESISFYRILAKANPDRPGFWRLIGDAASAKGELEVALVSYQKAIEAGYDDPSMRAAIEGVKAQMAKASLREQRR